MPQTKQKNWFYHPTATGKSEARQIFPRGLMMLSLLVYLIWENSSQAVCGALGGAYMCPRTPFLPGHPSESSARSESRLAWLSFWLAPQNHQTAPCSVGVHEGNLHRPCNCQHLFQLNKQPLRSFQLVCLTSRGPYWEQRLGRTRESSLISAFKDVMENLPSWGPSALQDLWRWAGEAEWG